MKVTIAIVTYNQRRLLKACLESIFAHTKHPRHKIAIWSNGCTDGTMEMLDMIQRRHPWRLYVFQSPRNVFFVQPNNFIINKFRHSDILMLNNDVEVLQDGWLTALQKAAYSEPNIGAVGPKVIGTHGDLRCAGAELFADGHGNNYGQGGDPDAPEFNEQKYVGYVGGCCLYMRRDAIDKFGALDERYHPMYYEESVWQYNLHRYGWHTLYVPSVVIRHHEGSTAGTDINSGMKQYQEINRAKFVEDFGEEIAKGEILV